MLNRHNKNKMDPTRINNYNFRFFFNKNVDSVTTFNLKRRRAFKTSVSVGVSVLQLTQIASRRSVAGLTSF